MSLTLTLERGSGDEVSGSGTNIELEGTIAGGAIESVKMYGDTEQAASPTPDSPQEVQTVSGEQTITISDGGSQSETYTLNLGSIELCKIGTYQDYIYKSGDDWYTHKAIGKQIVTGDDVYEGSFYGGFWRTPIYTTRFTDGVIKDGEISGRLTGYAISDKFHNTTADEVGAMYKYLNQIIIYYPTTIQNDAQARAWIDANTPTFYYALATATDTQITDSTLVGQLNALNSADTYDGTTVITVSSESLAGPLEVMVSTSVAKTYTEVEIGSPFTISDVEGKSSTTTLNGNVYVDFAYSKKAFQVDIFNLSASDYSDIRDFYDYQFTSGKFITLSIPELSISNMPVYMEMSKRNIVSQCLTTDKLTLNFRETVQP
jgi:hypothetical protein